MDTGSAPRNGGRLGSRAPRLVRGLAAAWNDPGNDWRLMGVCFVVACLIVAATALGTGWEGSRPASAATAAAEPSGVRGPGPVVGDAGAGDSTLPSRAQ